MAHARDALHPDPKRMRVASHGTFVSQHGRRIVLPIVTFYSNAKKPFHLLSNFSQLATPIEIRGLRYPSSEHAFQAQLLIDDAERIKYTVDGALGALRPAAFEALGYSRMDAEKKCGFWGKKHMVGILAKMAIRLDKRAGRTRSIDADECYRIFYDILMAKFVTDMASRDALLMTGLNTYLLEFVRSAERLWKQQNVVERWGGMISTSSHVIGHNQMGQLMMDVRLDVMRSCDLVDPVPTLCRAPAFRGDDGDDGAPYDWYEFEIDATHSDPMYETDLDSITSIDELWLRDASTVRADLGHGHARVAAAVDVMMKHPDTEESFKVGSVAGPVGRAISEILCRRSATTAAPVVVVATRHATPVFGIRLPKLTEGGTF